MVNHFDFATATERRITVGGERDSLKCSLTLEQLEKIEKLVSLENRLICMKRELLFIYFAMGASRSLLSKIAKSMFSKGFERVQTWSQIEQLKCESFQDANCLPEGLVQELREESQEMPSAQKSLETEKKPVVSSSFLEDPDQKLACKALALMIAAGVSETIAIGALSGFQAISSASVVAPVKAAAFAGKATTAGFASKATTAGFAGKVAPVVAATAKSSVLVTAGSVGAVAVAGVIVGYVLYHYGNVLLLVSKKGVQFFVDLSTKFFVRCVGQSVDRRFEPDPGPVDASDVARDRAIQALSSPIDPPTTGPAYEYIHSLLLVLYGIIRDENYDVRYSTCTVDGQTVTRPVARLALKISAEIKRTEDQNMPARNPLTETEQCVRELEEVRSGIDGGKKILNDALNSNFLLFFSNSDVRNRAYKTLLGKDQGFREDISRRVTLTNLLDRLGLFISGIEQRREAQGVEQQTGAVRKEVNADCEAQVGAGT